MSRLLVLALLIVLLAPAGAAAQEPARERAFVYGLNAAFARTYTGSFAPPAAGTIYLLADQPSIISPRMTQIYFWPITNEYKASWELLNEPVAGTLEILQGGRVIQQTQATSYTIQFQRNGPNVVADLFIGADAEAAQANFAAEQKRYANESASYYRDQQAWIAEADEANRRIRNGEKDVTLRPMPVPPAPITVTSNGLNQGIPVSLPVGSYQIQLRGPDGAIVADSRRRLEVFAPRRRAIGYTVVPETRWTTPDEIDDPTAIIVGKPDSQLYLVPHEVEEYPARAYTLLQNPQQQVSAGGEWQWVVGAPIESGELEVVSAAGEARRSQLTPYRVQQIPGGNLGYEIMPFEADPASPERLPDLVGFPLSIGAAGNSYEIRIVSAQGQVLASSARLVRAPVQVPLQALAALMATPLAAGAAVLLRRRMRMRLPRNVAG